MFACVYGLCCVLRCSCVCSCFTGFSVRCKKLSKQQTRRAPPIRTCWCVFLCCYCVCVLCSVICRLRALLAIVVLLFLVVLLPLPSRCVVMNASPIICVFLFLPRYSSLCIGRCPDVQLLSSFSRRFNWTAPSTASVFSVCTPCTPSWYVLFDARLQDIRL